MPRSSMSVRNCLPRRRWWPGSAVCCSRRAMPALTYALKSLGGAAVLAAVLVAPGLYEQFLGMSVIHGSVQSVPLPASDLLAPVVPTRLQLIDPIPSLSVPVVGPNLVE